MIYSIIYILGFMTFMIAFMFYPKASKINFAVNCMLSYVTAMIYGAMSALIIQILGIFVGIKSLSGAYFIGATIIFLLILRKKKLQLVSFYVRDVFVFILGVMCIGILGVHIFSRHLNINYYNMCDPANHFLYAANITRNGTVSGMFFNALHNAMFMEVFQPLVPETWNYKLFILSDGFQTLMEWYFFYCVITYKMKNSKHKFVPLFITILYCCGYPLYCYAGGAYIYWAMGAMLVQYVYLVMTLYEEQECFKKTHVMLMLLGCFGITLCYIQFAPAAFIMVAALLFYYAVKSGKIIFNKKFYTLVAVFATICALCAGIGYYFIFVKNNISIWEAFQLGTNTSKNLELLVFVPVFYYIIYWHVKNKEFNAYSIALCSYIFVHILLTILATVKLVSSYYLFKDYFILWALLWLAIVSEKRLFQGKAKKYLTHYLLLACMLLMFTYMPQEDRETTDSLSLDNSIWRYNAVFLKEVDYREAYLNKDKVEVMEYAADYAQKNNVTVAMIGSNALKGVCAWYQGITNQPYYWTSPVDEEVIQSYTQQTGYKYIIMLKDCDAYTDSKTYLDTLEKIYETDDGLIFKMPDEF